MPSSLILVNDAFISHTVDYWHGVIVGLGSSLVVAAFDGGIYFLDVGAYHGTERGIMAATVLTLSGAFAGLWRVSQV